jgi:hypothetical protein
MPPPASVTLARATEAIPLPQAQMLSRIDRDGRDDCSDLCDDRGAMSRHNKTTRYGQPPPERPRHEPPVRGVGPVPNPRRPRLVRDVHGGVLQDLFVIFPDLPRPPRPSPRLRSTIARARRKH